MSAKQARRRDTNVKEEARFLRGEWIDPSARSTLTATHSPGTSQPQGILRLCIDDAVTYCPIANGTKVSLTQATCQSMMFVQISMQHIARVSVSRVNIFVEWTRNLKTRHLKGWYGIKSISPERTLKNHRALLRERGAQRTNNRHLRHKNLLTIISNSEIIRVCFCRCRFSQWIFTSKLLMFRSRVVHLIYLSAVLFRIIVEHKLYSTTFT